MHTLLFIMTHFDPMKLLGRKPHPAIHFAIPRGGGPRAQS